MAAPASTLTAHDQELRKGRITSTRMVKLVKGQALAVWNEMMGIAQPLADNPRMRFGRKLERTIIEAAAEDRGWGQEGSDLGILYQPGTVTRGDYATSPDAIVEHYGSDNEPTAVRVIEAKNRGADQAHRYSGDEATEDEIIQCAWHMLVTGIPAATVCVLLGGNDLRLFDQVRDTTTLEPGLKDIADRFLTDYVRPQRPPPMDASDAAAEYLRARFPKHSAPMLTADPVLETWAVELREATVAADTWAERVETLKNRIKNTLGEAEGVEGGFGRITWKATKPSRKTDWKGVAEHLHAAPELIAEYTEEAPGSRRFLCTWRKS